MAKRSKGGLSGAFDSGFGVGGRSSRKKKGGGILANAFKPEKAKKRRRTFADFFYSGPKSKRKRELKSMQKAAAKGLAGGIVGGARGAGRRADAFGDAFAGGMGKTFDRGSRTWSSSRSMSSRFVQQIRDRLSPTEKLQVKEAAEEVIQENDRLAAQRDDNKLRGNESFIRQLMAELVKRFRR